MTNTLTEQQIEFLNQHLTDEQKAALLRNVEINDEVIVYDVYEDFNELMSNIEPLDLIIKAKHGGFNPTDCYYTYEGDWITSYTYASDVVNEFWDKNKLANCDKEVLEDYDFIKDILDEMEA